jgi:hypothetical protein
MYLSPFLSARVRMLTASEPAPGSLMDSAPMCSPARLELEWGLGQMPDVDMPALTAIGAVPTRRSANGQDRSLFVLGSHVASTAAQLTAR